MIREFYPASKQVGSDIVARGGIGLLGPESLQEETNQYVWSPPACHSQIHLHRQDDMTESPIGCGGRNPVNQRSVPLQYDELPSLTIHLITGSTYG